MTERSVRTTKETNNIRIQKSLTKYEDEFVYSAEYWRHLFSKKMETPMILQHHKITFFLKSINKSKAFFKCTVCDVWFNSLHEINKHMKKQEHLDNLKVANEIVTCHLIPPLTNKLLNIISLHLDDVVFAYCLTEKEVKQRMEVENGLNVLLKDQLPGGTKSKQNTN